MRTMFVWLFFPSFPITGFQKIVGQIEIVIPRAINAGKITSRKKHFNVKKDRKNSTDQLKCELFTCFLIGSEVWQLSFDLT